MPVERKRVLAVDDDPTIRRLVEGLLTGDGYQVDTAASCAEAMDVVQADDFHGVIVLDVRLPDCTGPELLPKLSRQVPDSPVVFLTGYGTTDLALESIRSGAYDFIEKAQLVQRLLPTVRAAFATMPDGGASSRSPFAHIVTRSASMRTVFRSLRLALESRVPVLIRGESGTGKELVAQAIHRGGPRADGPFVGVNCAGIPEHLLEAELFGYERGAFTGAVGRKPGRFDLAQRGTLLLDEIGEMQPSLQAKLLRVLQEGEYQRLGGVQTLHADVRVVSATNRDVESEVEKGRFREDLYYRLAVFTVELPPLRERHGDVPLLVEHFVRAASRRENKEVGTVDRMAMDVLESYSFPGNVRQLENVIAHAVVSARGTTVRLADLPQSFLRAAALERGRAEEVLLAPAPEPKPEEPKKPAAFPTLQDMERSHIQAALRLTSGNKAHAARLLGISRMTLYRKIGDLGL